MHVRMSRSALMKPPVFHRGGFALMTLSNPTHLQGPPLSTVVRISFHPLITSQGESNSDTQSPGGHTQTYLNHSREKALWTRVSSLAKECKSLNGVFLLERGYTEYGISLELAGGPPFKMVFGMTFIQCNAEVEVTVSEF